MANDLLTTWGLSLVVDDATHPKLTVGLGAVARHAGCLLRIYWDQAHCARGNEVKYPIGQ
jgi:hypothetical protein